MHVCDSFGLGDAMRGEDQRSEGFFSYVPLERRIPADHPLRAIRSLTDEALAGLSRDFKGKLYARDGRPSISPEDCCGLCCCRFSIRYAQRAAVDGATGLQHAVPLVRGIEYGRSHLGRDGVHQEPRTVAERRHRAGWFFQQGAGAGAVRRACFRREHFTVDGTLIEAWASMKSFVPKDGSDPPAGQGQGGSGGRNAERDFHGEKRKNDTHSSTTDPDARLFRKGAGKEAKLCHMGHLMTENRNGLIVDARVTEANGTAERETALDMIKDNAKPGSTVGGDKNYDTADFVAGCRKRGCTPHVSQNNTNRRSAIDARTTRHSGLSHQHGQAEADRGTLRLDQDRRRSAQDTPLRTGAGRMVLCPDRCRLQSHSHSEDLGGNGMSLSGGLKMKQKHSQYRACSADHGLSILLLHSQTSRKSASEQTFSAAC